MSLSKFALTVAASCLVVTPAWADAVVRMLHIETNPVVLEIWQQAADDFESANPGVTVEYEGMETQAFKSRLTTLLQSNSKPDIIYSWGGGLVDARVKAGVLDDVTERVDPGVIETLVPAGVSAYTREGRLYGLPYLTSEMGLLVNKALLDEAGVAIEDLDTWSGFLEAVAKLKAANITPIAVGGQDKWQLGAMYSTLALKVGGEAALSAAWAGEEGGFDAPTFVRAGELLRELADAQPFQPGYLAAKAQTSGSQFSDGKAAMLMYGTWFFRLNPTLAADKIGLPTEQMEFIGFPGVDGGVNSDKESIGQLNGWLFTQGASDESVRFLEHFLGEKYQSQLATGGFIIPAVRAAQDEVSNPIMKRVAGELSELDFLQLNYDTQLGPNAGATANDIAVAIVAGQLSPADAARQLENARQVDEQLN
ncbi:extracellular solute-binding protein [Devosia sp. YIM 151766]|uniref:extracellular solute-binding protein n=1 Tax=Devosia sp. YIM 151766 TaxID=3017325 RepID=UPI00255C6597|nr:extracellular solute-binding protein [Devosia sp. YIM 151766]WIY53894.1 extracellular solute-binding protein [Devosia sp. YIM 151766]